MRIAKGTQLKSSVRTTENGGVSKAKEQNSERGGR